MVMICNCLFLRAYMIWTMPSRCNIFQPSILRTKFLRAF
uniref:Uncharacterized protein n=1 Tax=Arundo donax TaxID=35708 RepID=A0A0A9HFR9_ARUDO